MAVMIGWDIGGVHLKAARAENGRIVAATQVASPLRGGLESLMRAFAEAKTTMGTPDLHAVTMTAELADTFLSRADGVVQVTALASKQLTDAPVWLYAGPRGFISPERAASHVTDLASANWHASAAFAGQRCANALFVDMGSTTTDIVPVRDGVVAARGYSDAQRLAAGELVYTGLVRSYLMATAAHAPFAGTWTPLIAENFATMADIHRILGTLPLGADQMTTADGREKTAAAAQARLARMVGRDAADADAAAWTALAHWFAEVQVQAVTDAAMLAASAVPLPADAPVVVAGIGAGVVEEVARRLRRRTLPFGDLLDAVPDARTAAAQCAPAAALALLGASVIAATRSHAPDLISL